MKIQEIGNGYIYVIGDITTGEIYIAPFSKSPQDLGGSLSDIKSRNIWKRNNEFIEGKSVLPIIRNYIGYLLKRNRKFDDIQAKFGYSYDGKTFEIDNSVDWGEEDSEREWEKRFWMMYDPDEV